MQVLIKKGVATIKMLQRQHDTLEGAVEIAETIAGLTHEAAPAAKKVLEGLNELAAILPRSRSAEAETQTGAEKQEQALGDVGIVTPSKNPAAKRETAKPAA